MPFAGPDDYFVAPKKCVVIDKASATAEGAQKWHSTWQMTGEPAAGAAAGSLNGAIPTSATTGAAGFENGAAGEESRIGRLAVELGNAGGFILVDRLWHNSAIDCNVATDQNITAPALTRYTDGRGLELWGECFAAWGAGAFTLTITFLDDMGAAKTATYAWPANAPTVGQAFKIPLGAGVNGIKSVTKAKLSVGSGAVGNLGLFLCKRLTPIVGCAAAAIQERDWVDTGTPDVEDNACLHGIVRCTTTATGTVFAEAEVGYR